MSKTDKRITPPPVREEQAKLEAGLTGFDPGIKTGLSVFFLGILLCGLLLQFAVPPEFHARLAGHAKKEPLESLATNGAIRICGTVQAVSSPPNRKAVYRDFIMRIHLVNIRAPKEAPAMKEAVVGFMGMHDRRISPASRIKPGTAIEAWVVAWEDVAEHIAGLNGSRLAGDEFLAMPRLWAYRLSGDSGQLTAGGGFLDVWTGNSAELPSQSRIGVFGGMARAASSEDGLLDSLLSANAHLAARIDVYEDVLDKSAVPALVLRPHVQAVLASLGAGNEEAYIGSDGWLFYAPDVKSLTGPGFLNATAMKSRLHGGKAFTSPPRPDPRPAIIDFRNQLERQGIELILLPTPGKPSIHPEKLNPGLANLTEPVRNSSFDEFANWLREEGISFLDPAPLLKRNSCDEAQYLKTDTHWTPKAMQSVAVSISEMIAPLLDRSTTAPWPASNQTNTQLGDIAVMLDMAEWQTVVEPETVTSRRVADRNEGNWRPDPEAETLLLGDSFANIYSIEGMGWGASAGLAEQIAYELEQPVNRICRNDNGAYASREMLAEALKRDSAFMDKTRVVIWQFAERELSFGDWRLIPLPFRSSPVEEIGMLEVAHVSHAESAYSNLADKASMNNRVVLQGKDNWLFLVSELNHLAGPPVPEAARSKPAEDAFSSLLDFKAALDELGIALIVVPVPPRAAIYADKLFDDLPRRENGIPVRLDTGLARFNAELRKRGVQVIDLCDDFLAARANEGQAGPVCCPRDSHWSPRGIRIAAKLIAEEVRSKMELPGLSKERFILHPPEQLIYKGDLNELTEAPSSVADTTSVERVVLSSDPAEHPASNPKSPALLLADSHGLVFSAGGELHCKGAGIAEHLAYELSLPLDVMARRGSGASVRIDLARRFLQNPKDAQGKRVVIYIFAARDLTESNEWKPVPLSR